MLRTPKVGTRFIAGVATCVTVMGVTVPLLATAASAAVNTITANPSTYSAAAGTTQPVTADVSRTSNDVTPVRFIIAGPDGGTNGASVADGTCDPVGTTQVTCAVSNTTGPQTDTVTIFVDVNGDSARDAGEPSTTATVVFYGNPTSITLAPSAGQAAAGTCKAFTVTAKDANSSLTPGKVINLQSVLTGTVASRDLAFCDPDGAGTATDAGGDNVTQLSTDTTGTPINGTVTTRSTATGLGTATFGLQSNEPGSASLRAFYDAQTGTAGTTNIYNVGEPTATATQTWTAGGTGQTASDAVTALTVTPTTNTSFQNETVTYTVTAKNSAGDTVPNAVVLADITSGPNAAVTPSCGTTVNDGTTTCTYAPLVANGTGTDSITFFVNQTNGAGAGPDANEPKAVATNTVAAAPSGNSITLTCADSTATGATTTDCIQPVSTTTEAFTALVTKGTDSAGKPIGVPGILVRFSVTSGTGTVTPLSAVTDSAGIAKTTLTQTTPANGDSDEVTAVIAGQAADNSAVATTTFQTPVTTTVTLTPLSNTTQTGAASSFVATVVTQFGQPIANRTVNFAFLMGSRNFSLNGGANTVKTTDANGKATFTYTDQGSLTTAGPNDVIRATADGVQSSDDATNRFITEAPVAATVDLDVTNQEGCPTGTVDPANDSESYDPSTAIHEVCAIAKTAGGVNLDGKTITFTLTGVGSFVSNDGKNTVLTSPQTAVIDSSGYAYVFVRSTASGAQNIAAALDGKSDAGTVTYAAPNVYAARFIDLKPDTSNVAAGQNVELTARVTDRFGNPVQGVTVDFNENGAGRFSNGTSNVSGVTGSTGTITVTFTSDAGTTGTDAVTATINEIATTGYYYYRTECQNGPDTETTPVTPAGNCSDASTYTFTTAPTSVKPTINANTGTILAGQLASITVKGTPGDSYDVLAANRPSSVFVLAHQGVFGADGSSTFTIHPLNNVNFVARTAGGVSSQVIVSVHTGLNIGVKKSGHTLTFYGQIYPNNRNQTVYIKTGTSIVGIATRDASGKNWTFTHNFASGAGQAVVFYSFTASDTQNANGHSQNLRAVL